MSRLDDIIGDAKQFPYYGRAQQFLKMGIKFEVQMFGTSLKSV